LLSSSLKSGGEAHRGLDIGEGFFLLAGPEGRGGRVRRGLAMMRSQVRKVKTMKRLLGTVLLAVAATE